MKKTFKCLIAVVFAALFISASAGDIAPYRADGFSPAKSKKFNNLTGPQFIKLYTTNVDAKSNLAIRINAHRKEEGMETLSKSEMSNALSGYYLDPSEEGVWWKVDKMSGNHIWTGYDKKSGDPTVNETERGPYEMKDGPEMGFYVKVNKKWKLIGSCGCGNTCADELHAKSTKKDDDGDKDDEDDDDGGTLVKTVKGANGTTNIYIKNVNTANNDGNKFYLIDPNGDGVEIDAEEYEKIRGSRRPIRRGGWDEVDGGYGYSVRSYPRGYSGYYPANSYELSHMKQQDAGMWINTALNLWNTGRGTYAQFFQKGNGGRGGRGNGGGGYTSGGRPVKGALNGGW